MLFWDGFKGNVPAKVRSGSIHHAVALEPVHRLIWKGSPPPTRIIVVENFPECWCWLLLTLWRRFRA